MFSVGFTDAHSRLSILKIAFHLRMSHIYRLTWKNNIFTRPEPKYAKVLRSISKCSLNTLFRARSSSWVYHPYSTLYSSFFKLGISYVQYFVEFVLPAPNIIRAILCRARLSSWAYHPDNTLYSSFFKLGNNTL